MSEGGSRFLLILAVAMAIASILLMYGAVRYIRRLPQDTFGVALHIITCVLFAVLATINFIRWAQERKSGSPDK